MVWSELGTRKVFPQRLVAWEDMVKARGVFGVLVGKWIDGKSLLRHRAFIWIPIGHAQLLPLDTNLLVGIITKPPIYRRPHGPPIKPTRTS
jgi:hypothetical protein